MKTTLFISLTLFLYLSGFSQQQKSVFDQIQENVWYLPTDDGQAQLYLTSIGAGDTIIALTGGPGNNFNYLVDAVEGNSFDYTFILYDQRGSILSPVHDSLVSDLSIDLLVEDLELIRKSLGQEKMVLMGHSFGSLLGMFYYIKYPDNVKRLILTATMPPHITEEKPFSEKISEIHHRVKNLRNREAVTNVLTKERLLIDSLLSPKEKSDKFKITGQASFNMFKIENWRNFKGGGVYYNYAVDSAIGSSIPGTYSIAEKLNNYPIPITIIQGDKDYIDPSAKYWSSILSTFDFVNLIVIPNASHNSWLDDKKSFDKSLSKAIKGDFPED